MIIVAGLLTLLAITHAGGEHIKGGSHHIKGISSITQEKIAQEDIIPSPYSFDIKTGTAYGTKVTREETGDSDGRVKGTYAITSPRGTSRVVQYHADDSGFHANVKTSEPNVKTHSPANAQVVVVSKTVPGPEAETTKRGIKTLGSSDVQLRDPIALPVIQSVSNTKDAYTPVSKSPSSASVKQVSRKSPVSAFSTTKSGSLGASLYQTDAQRSMFLPGGRNKFDTSSLTYTSSVSTGGALKPVDRQTITSLSSGNSQESGIKIITDKGEITLNQETFNSLQNMGGVTNENGVLTLTDEAIKIIQGMGESISGQTFSYFGTPKLPATGNLASPISTVSRQIISEKVMSRSYPQNLRKPALQSAQVNPIIRSGGPATRQMGQTLTSSDENIVLFNGKEISVDQIREGQIFDENLKPILTVDSNIIKEGVRSSSGISGIRSSPVAGRRVISGVDSRYSTGQIKPVTRTVQMKPFVRTAQTSSGLAQGVATLGTSGNTVLFNGREISIGQVREGQIFDANLKPILSVDPGNIIREEVKTSGNSGVTTSKITGGRIITRVDPKYAPGLVKPVIRTVQVKPGYRTTQVKTTQIKPVARTAQIKPFVRTAQISSGLAQGVATLGASGNTVLFNGKEINIGQVREGQIFDANLKPILSVDPGNIIREKVRTSGNRGATTSQITGGGIITRVVPKYATRQLKPDVQTVQVKPISRTTQIKPAVRTAQIKPFVRRVQTSSGLAQGVATLGTSGNTVLFNGKEISIGQVREGQIFDANLKPILSVDPGNIAEGQRILTGTRESTVSQIPIRKVISRVDSKFATGQIKPDTRTVQSTSSQIKPFVRTVQTSSGLAQGVATLGTSGNTVLFNGKEISIGQIREGQIFDENLKPILSVDPGNIIEGERILTGTREATVPQIPIRKVISKVDSKFTTGQMKPFTRIDQSTSAQIKPFVRTVQTSPGLAQGVATLGTSGNTVLFNGKEISIGQIREGQIFDENLKPIMSVDSGNIIENTFSTRTGGATMSQVAGRRVITRGDSKYTARQTKPATVSQVKPILRTTEIKPFTRTTQIKPIARTVEKMATLDQGVTKTRPLGQSLASSAGNTVLFEGKEISIDQIREGQVFDENLKPIMSIDSGSIVKEAPLFDTAGVTTSQVAGGIVRVESVYPPGQLKPTTRINQMKPITRISQFKPTLRRTQTTSVSGQGGTASKQYGQTLSSSTGNVVLFNGREVYVNNIREGQIFDENLKPILSTDPGNILKENRVLVRPQSDLTSTSGNSGTNSFGSVIIRSNLPQTDLRSSNIGASDIASGTSSGFSGLQEASLSGTVLFDGREITMSGLKAGQIYDENLQPITAYGSEKSEESSSVSSQAGLRSSVQEARQEYGRARLQPNTNVPLLYLNRGKDSRSKINQGNQEISQSDVQTKVIHDFQPFAVTQDLENVKLSQEGIQQSYKDLVKTVPSAKTVPWESNVNEQAQMQVDVQEKVPIVLERKLPKRISQQAFKPVDQKQIFDPSVQLQIPVLKPGTDSSEQQKVEQVFI